ncbi:MULTISPECIES: ABC transporter substrate-binding protein [Nocardiopsidaceae]|uniref:ABC transporter substrate-binding protein n=1 Tax=Streptomonospora nanhaiensis TaxID=1323731 RepID=A0ABY6YUU7_9ACTN|nr:ABC transporter substrate-binding protein [Streptomonospora nanhaiensis]WAE76157.1 ABC transporter substrate-binding protein [Streptomonospora nanhaiensis]
MVSLPRTARTLVTVAALGSLLACGGSPQPPAPEEPEGGTRTVEAANGPVEIPATPHRIAVLWRPTLAAVTLLGHDVVATMGTPGGEDQGLAPFLPEGADGGGHALVTNSPSEEDVDVEELANAAPDLIIGVSTPVGAQADMLESLEAIAPTVLLEWEGTGSWRGHLDEVAGVLDASEEAGRALEAYEEAVASARGDIEAAGVDPAATELSLVRLQSGSEIRLETAESFPGQVVDDLGFARPEGQLEGEGPSDYIAQSYENLDRADGDAVFVMAGSGYPDAPRTFSEGVWSNLDAVREEAVYRVDHDHWGAANHYAALRIVEDVRAALTGEAEPAL